MIWNNYIGQLVKTCEKMKNYEEKRLSAQLSFDILTISNILTDYFDELVALVKIKEESEEHYRLLELQGIYKFLINVIKIKADELKDISDHL